MFLHFSFTYRRVLYMSNGYVMVISLSIMLFLILYLVVTLGKLRKVFRTSWKTIIN